MSGVRAGNDLIKAAMSAPYLDRDEEHELAVLWKEKRDQEALHKIATAHMRLVISMAAKFRNFGLPMNDLIQEGHVGLLEAAARFEPDVLVHSILKQDVRSAVERSVPLCHRLAVS